MNLLIDIPHHSASGDFRVAGSEIVRLDPLAGEEWDALVDSHPEAGIFHRSAWARVLADTYGHRPYYLSCRERGRVIALIPLMEVSSPVTGRRGVSVPFADMAGPLCFPGMKVEVMQQAVDDVARERGWQHTEWRGGQTGAVGWQVSAAYLAHTLSLQPSLDDLQAGFDSATRRSLRKAEKGPLEVSIRHDEEAVRIFYQLHARTRRRHGLPPQPYSFFRHLHRHCLRGGGGAVVLASAGDRPVAAAVFLTAGMQAVYKFGASDERYPEWRGNHLVMWSALRWLKAKGLRHLHLGRTDLGQDGLRRYKLGWGTTESRLEYIRYAPGEAKSAAASRPSPGAAKAVFSRLPLLINRFCGSVLYPHLD